MTRLHLALALGLAAAPLSAQLPAAPAPPSAAGEWLGRLDAGAVSLKLGVSIRALRDGALEGDLDSYDQGALNIPFDSVRQEGATVRAWLRRIGATYVGTLSADGRTLAGTWTQGPGSTPLQLQRADSAALAAARPRRPQEPVGPLPYDTTAVTFESAPGVRLAGTFTHPRGTARVPAVVLVSGSGPQDRDETLLGHKPFLVLADYLTRHGIAVLRYDDRGTYRSGGSFATATSLDFAADAQAAAAWLRARPDVRADAVGIVGHSEGGLIAPIVATRTKDVAFLVLLAGPGLPGDSILLLQSELISKAMGVPDSVRAANAGLSRRMYAAIRAEPDSLRLAARLRALGESLAPAERARAGMSGAALDATVAQLSSPWFRYFVTYDPRETLRRVRVPVLALNGTLDLQVPPEADLAAIGAALAAAGNRDHEEVALPGLNHLFQTSRAGTGAPGEYATLEETMSPAALEKVASWISKRYATK